MLYAIKLKCIAIQYDLNRKKHNGWIEQRLFEYMRAHDCFLYILQINTIYHYNKPSFNTFRTRFNCFSGRTAHSRKKKKPSTFNQNPLFYYHRDSQRVWTCFGRFHVFWSRARYFFTSREPSLSFFVSRHDRFTIRLLGWMFKVLSEITCHQKSIYGGTWFCSCENLFPVARDFARVISTHTSFHDNAII